MRRWWACAWLLSLAACAQEAPPLPDPTALGLAEAPTEHVIAGAAIRKAATILGPDAKIKLYPGWRGRERGVAIYTLTSDSLAASEVIGTYDECGCILLSNARLEAWLVGEMGTGIGRLDIDRTALLTYMLLHEAGHIAQGKTPCGLALSGGAASATVDARLNMTDTAQKACERTADRYASEAVRAALEHKGSDRGRGTITPASSVANEDGKNNGRPAMSSVWLMRPSRRARDGATGDPPVPGWQP